VGVTAPVVSHVTGSTTTEVTPGIGQKVGSTKTYNHNGLKSVEAQSQSASALSSTRVYDAWGAVVSSTGTHAGRFGHGGAYGYQSDSNDLQLLGHRFYDPNMGRFLTRDAIKDGRNWYAYGENNPLKHTDPTGLNPDSTPAIVNNETDHDIILLGDVIIYNPLLSPYPIRLPAVIVLKPGESTKGSGFDPDYGLTDVTKEGVPIWRKLIFGVEYNAVDTPDGVGFDPLGFVGQLTDEGGTRLRGFEFTGSPPGMPFTGAPSIGKAENDKYGELPWITLPGLWPDPKGRFRSPMWPIKWSDYL